MRIDSENADGTYCSLAVSAFLHKCFDFLRNAHRIKTYRSTKLFHFAVLDKFIGKTQMKEFRHFFQVQLGGALKHRRTEPTLD